MSKIPCALALFALASCGAPNTAKQSASAATPAGWNVFGAGVAQPAMPLAQVLEAPQKYAGKTIAIEGPVTGVCQVKGCWMTMQHADKEMRIRFKDYAYFVPKDCAGKTARVEGVFAIETIPIEEARHYLEDAGKPEEAAKITAPVDGYTFMASGVLLHD